MNTITLLLTAMAHGGSALGRVGNKVIFVPYALPGETVEVRLVDDRGRWANAELVRVIDASPDRVTPPCPHFGPASVDLPTVGAGLPYPYILPIGDDAAPVVDAPVRGCGGCQWQHIAYPAQLKLKQAIVRDQFARVGKLPDVNVLPMLGMSEPWLYRNHVQLHASEEGPLGFRALGEHTVIPIQVCDIMAPAVEGLWRSLDLEFDELRQVILRGDMGTDDSLILLKSEFDTLPELEVDFPVSIDLELRDGQVVTLIGAPWLMARVAGRDFRVSAESFFQVNTQMAEVLVRLVREGLRPGGGQTLLDLYAGVGLFGLTLAEEVGQVIAIETSPSAVADWHVNAAGLDNVEMREGLVEAILPHLSPPVDLVVLDPPRAGCEPAVIDALAALRPSRIVYVSCDPATLARDAARFVGHGYDLSSVQPVDLFPQTWHIECVALFDENRRDRLPKPVVSAQPNRSGGGGKRERQTGRRPASSSRGGRR